MAGVAVLALAATAGSAYARAGDSNDPKWNDQASNGPTNAELEARIEALEAEVQSAEMNQAKDRDALGAATTALTGWWNNTSISGRVYFDLSNIENKNDGVANPANGFHFDIKRFYLGIDHKFDDVWSANVTTDFNYDSGPAGATQLYIKKAYLQGKFADAAVLRLGAADLPWIPFVEDVYGYRYVENTLVDRIKYGTSSDWGVHLGGKFGNPDGVLFEYQVAAINGAGYKKPGIGLGTNRSKGMDFEGRVDVRYANFIAAVGGYTGKLGKDLGPLTTFHTASRIDALVGYVGNGIHAGVEYYHDNNFDTVTALPSDKGDGWSVFGAYQFTPEWAVFGRYDTTKPTKSLQPAFTNRYYNIGVEWTPVKIVNLSVVYKRDQGSAGGVIGDSNGTIGGPLTGGAYDEIGLFAQFRW
jgi:hypothetical protein